MFCRKNNNLLARAAEYYSYLGYQIGVSKDKVLISDLYQPPPYLSSKIWDNISIILDGLVCVDFDRFVNIEKDYILPPTLKERSPRGLHYIYRLPRRFVGKTRIRWKNHIDLLTWNPNYNISYGKKELSAGHVLCSPSKGYTKLYPRAIPRKTDLPMAPDWVLANLN